jgi:catechol 2,3-dioxygenase-like lactoylglutathione lyase family enzyme
MPLEKLDHYFVYAKNLDASRDFYSEMLGLEEGPRPDFGFPGYWFYLEGRAVVHLGNEDFEGGMEGADKKVMFNRGTGPLDHIAFRGTDIEDFISRFESSRIEYNRREVPDFKLSQLFVEDPNGVTIELNFFYGE